MAASPDELFIFCPRCGAHALASRAPGLLVCGACELHFHLNAACAVGALILNQAGALLLVERLHDPARGKLDLPGGFVDQQETAEDALRREVREETALELRTAAYLCSFPNRYDYRGVRYHTLDMFFVCTPHDASAARAADEAASISWRAPAAILPSELAFDSIRRAIARFIA